MLAIHIPMTSITCKFAFIILPRFTNCDEDEVNFAGWKWSGGIYHELNKSPQQIIPDVYMQLNMGGEFHFYSYSQRHKKNCDVG